MISYIQLVTVSLCSQFDFDKIIYYFHFPCDILTNFAYFLTDILAVWAQMICGFSHIAFKTLKCCKPLQI